MITKKPIKLHLRTPDEFNYDKEFLVILENIRDCAERALEKHSPSVQSQTQDSYLQGRLSMIKAVIKEYIND